MRLYRAPYRTLALVALSGAAVSLGGCAQMRTHEGYIADAALVESVTPGIDNRASVERTLGRPTLASQFGVVDGRPGMTNVDQASDWYYISRNNRALAFARPRTREQQTIHVQFDTIGNVATMNTTGVETVTRLSPIKKKTPTLGRQRTFFEDLFGNIGSVGAVPGGAGGAQQP